mmetsp:Transcript_82426/g.96408  ORF Transcript_82426/g.96408 Transcript_82426/m.96408 type:complete len:181 (+) Transcript_82426:23-565(+)
MIKKSASALRLLASSQLKSAISLTRTRAVLGSYEDSTSAGFGYQQKFWFSEQNKDSKGKTEGEQPVSADIVEEDIMKQIDSWVKDNKCLLFMKGIPQAPRCGYSKFVVEVLKFYKVKDYHAVDVLKSQLLRDSIKTYSNWPTFPQLYVNGKLIGGSDIVNEMHKEGSFKKLLEEHNLISP